jgi:hypothetical protein
MSAFDFSSLDLTDYGPPTQLGARTPPLGAINASTRERRRQLSALRLSLLPFKRLRHLFQRSHHFTQTGEERMQAESTALTRAYSEESRCRL